MTDMTAARADLAAKILPAIVAGADWDDYNPEFPCPQTYINYFVIPLREVDIDEGDESRFRIDAMTGTDRCGIYFAKDLDECKTVIADQVAANLIEAKRHLIDASNKLGLTSA